jgi:hypothetical protein
VAALIGNKLQAVWRGGGSAIGRLCKIRAYTTRPESRAVLEAAGIDRALVRAVCLAKTWSEKLAAGTIGSTKELTLTCLQFGPEKAVMEQAFSAAPLDHPRDAIAKAISSPAAASRR